jgi:hypothetical protein
MYTADGLRISRPKILGAFFCERAAGATQQALGDHYGLTQSGVSKYLGRHYVASTPRA